MGILFSSIATARLPSPPEGSTPSAAKWSKPLWWRIPRSEAPPPPPTARTPTPSFKAPPPTPSAPTPTSAPRCRPDPQMAFLQKLMLVSAAAIPAAVACIPFFVYLKTGSIETVVTIFRTPTLYSGAVNCIIWLFYSQIIRIVDLHADELVISNCFNLAFDYSFLMIAYGFRRSVWKGILLTLIVVPAMIYLFVALRFEVALHESWGPFLAAVGFLTIMVCHASQIMDITESTGDLGESLITAINILPGLIFNGCVCYWSLLISPDEHFVLWFQSLLNLLFCTLEMVLLIMNRSRRTPAVGVMANSDDYDDHRNRMPLIPPHGNSSNNTSASADSGRSSASSEPSASGSAIAARCSTQDVPPGMLMVPTLPASTSAGVAITLAPETVEGIHGFTLPQSMEEIQGLTPPVPLEEIQGFTLPTPITSATETELQGVTLPIPMDKMLEKAPLFAGLGQASSSAENPQVKHDRHADGKISETSKAYQTREEAHGTERARQLGANPAPVVSLSRCRPHWRRRKGATDVLPPIV